MPSERSEAGGQPRFRHEARTFLNHALGYAEMVAEAAAPPDAEPAVARFKAAAAALKAPMLAYLLALDADVSTAAAPAAPAGVEPAAPDSARVEALRDEAYGRIYDLMNAIQAVKRLRLEPGPEEDLRRVQDAVNSLVDLMRDREERGAFVPDAASVALGDEAGKAVRPGRILVVDDDAINRELLVRLLERQGHLSCQAADGQEALSILRQASFDIALVDLMMPGMNGFQFLDSIHADEALREVSVIMVSALEDDASIARCLELGAEDYLPRDFNPIILKARINNILEKREYKRRNEEALASLARAQSRLNAELRDAAAYVRSLLPQRVRWPGLAIDWEFIPSLSLGGDSFSYQRLEDGRLAFFLIDVSGHGIEAALLSVTVMNLLKAKSLGGLDYGSPRSVLAWLNESFRIEDQNNMYFTIWYGVWDPTRRAVRYATGGAPPALLCRPGEKAEELVSEGPIIGVDDTAAFPEREAFVPLGSQLYLFSDGLYEVRLKDGSLLRWADFVALFEAHSADCARSPDCISPIRRIVDAVRERSAREPFADDVSILELSFHGGR